MAIAAVDKTSPSAKNFQSIRSRMRNISEDEKIVPEPAPAAVETK